MSYGMVRVVDSGQQSDREIESDYEEIQINYGFQVFDDGSNNVIDREKRIVFDQNPKKMLHIKVKSDGYYQFRIYTDKWKDLTGSKLTIYRNVPKKYAFDPFSFNKYIETTYVGCDSFRSKATGEVRDGLVKNVRYSTKCYLRKNDQYYVEYQLVDSEKFNLIFGICTDQFQYDIFNPVGAIMDSNPKQWNSIETRYGAMLGDTIIAPILSTDDLKYIFDKADYPYDNFTKGMFCGIIWEVDPDCRKSGPYTNDEFGEMIYNYEMPMKIFYLDQMLGGWLYNKMQYIYDELKEDKAKKEKADSFIKGMFESSIAAAGGLGIQTVIEGGAFASLATPAGIAAGLVLTAMFLAWDGFNAQTPFEKFLHKFWGYVNGGDTRNALKTPVALLVGSRYNITTREESAFYDVVPWDGTTVSAVGGQYYYGKYTYCYTYESQLFSFYYDIREKMTGEPKSE